MIDDRCLRVCYPGLVKAHRVQQHQRNTDNYIRIRKLILSDGIDCDDGINDYNYDRR
jgi:hypothetical protein